MLGVYVFVSVCVCACVRACMCVCVCVYRYTRVKGIGNSVVCHVENSPSMNSSGSRSCDNGGWTIESSLNSSNNPR